MLSGLADEVGKKIESANAQNLVSGQSQSLPISCQLYGVQPPTLLQCCLELTGPVVMSLTCIGVLASAL